MRRALLKVGFEQGRAELCARLFAETDRDGVYTHGLNRFPRFLEMIEKGTVDVNASPVRVESHGAVERWDGRSGPGNLNAHESMARAVEREGVEAPLLNIERWRFTAKRAGARFGGQGCPRSRLKVSVA
jgi:LDH2 family malate/lactate/ureidoglycolate dehydrogenase